MVVARRSGSVNFVKNHPTAKVPTVNEGTFCKISQIFCYKIMIMISHKITHFKV